MRRGEEGCGGVMRGEEGEGFFILLVYLFIYASLNRPDTDQRALSIVHCP